MKPYSFTFKTILERNNGTFETEEEIKVAVRVENYAEAVGFLNERCRKRVFEITNIEHDGLPLSRDELDGLREWASNY